MYDIVILGGGPAGLTAALYAARYKINTAIISKDIGGQVNYAHKVENYPGFKEISGIELIKKMHEQLNSLKVRIINEEIRNIICNKDGTFTIITNTGSHHSKSIILAFGTAHRKLNLPEEKKFIGKGISYCAVCDAPLFKNKTVAVYGGSDSAASAALLLAKYASKVYIIYRKEKLRAEPLRVEQIYSNKKIEIVYNSTIEGIKGKGKVEAVVLNDKRELKVDGIFIEIGFMPASSLLGNLKIKMDKNEYIIVDRDMKTNIKGVFAAGDCISKSLRQIINAAGDGAIAAFSAYLYLKK